IVVGQSPEANSQQGRGSTVTLQVSEGPVTAAVPDVTSQSEEQARGALENEGFRVRVVREDTDDPTLDGIVTSQDPPGGTELEPGERITLFVGRFVEPPPEEEEPPPPPTTIPPTTVP
ncbi:MAG: PASTA domain-containing protein, partial [Actinobacteria bacterium]|nr:PASTA domain-containing protein [Actinomycetota bacterium]